MPTMIFNPVANLMNHPLTIVVKFILSNFIVQTLKCENKLEQGIVKNHHIQKLIERCPNITELGLNGTPLEDNCVDIIIRGFLKTLIKLSLPRSIQLSALHGHQNPRVTGPSKLSLGDLPNLKYFWFRQHGPTRIEEIEGEILGQMLPNAVINQGYLEIANPHEAFWDIQCKRADVFETVCLESISLYISKYRKIASINARY